MSIVLIILAAIAVLLALWDWWLLWDRKKKIQAISERREEIRHLKQERDVWKRAYFMKGA